MEARKCLTKSNGTPAVDLGHMNVVMMMIAQFAFITINSGLVQIEGLCAQILYFRSEIIGGLRSHLLLLFFGRKKC